MSKKLIITFISLAALFGHSGWAWSQSWYECTEIQDWGIQHMANPLPPVEPLPSHPIFSSLLQTVATKPTLQAVLHLHAGRYAELEKYFQFVAADTSIERQYEHYSAFAEAINNTEYAWQGRVEDWLNKTGSTYARLYLGILYQSAAWAARGRQYAQKTPKENFIWMEQRSEKALNLLTPLVQEKTAVATLTHQKLAEIYSARGVTELAGQHYDKALATAPRIFALYDSFLTFSLSRWVGDQSTDQANKIFKLAEKAGLTQEDLLQLRQIYEYYESQVSESSDPGAERALLDRHIESNPTFHNYLRRAYYDQRKQRWGEMIAVTEKMIELRPESGVARYLHGLAHQQLGRAQQARNHYLIATAYGNDRAFSNLMYAVLNGSLGFQAKDIRTLVELCRWGSAMGLPTAAHCLGALYFEAQGLPRDMERSVAWHQVAARGGHSNSQHDLGWILYSGKMTHSFPQQAPLFWLKRAAVQEHQFAKRKLEKIGKPVTGIHTWQCKLKLWYKQKK